MVYLKQQKQIDELGNPEAFLLLVAAHPADRFRALLIRLRAMATVASVGDSIFGVAG